MLGGCCLVSGGGGDVSRRPSGRGADPSPNGHQATQPSGEEHGGGGLGHGLKSGLHDEVDVVTIRPSKAEYVLRLTGLGEPGRGWDWYEGLARDERHTTRATTTNKPNGRGGWGAEADDLRPVVGSNSTPSCRS
jgi:hypothetical protein